MRRSFTLLFTTVVLLASLAAKAQTGPAYTGPRYPGGPDSLRALVYRSIRQAAPAPAGRLLLRFDLAEGQQPRNFRLVYPDNLVNSELVKAGTRTAEYLQNRMAAWQPGMPNPKAAPNTVPQISLVLNYPAPAANAPYAYADQPPIFTDLATAARANGSKSFRDSPDPAPQSLVRFVQMQSRYPAAALRQMQQGVVYVYLEVAENGKLEFPEVVGTVGTVGPELAAEVMRVVAQLPNANTPAQLAGRPVRVFYVLPITFKIQ